MSQAYLEKSQKTLKYPETWAQVEHLLLPLEKGLQHASWVLGHDEKSASSHKIWKFFSSQAELEAYLKSFRQEGG